MCLVRGRAWMARYDEVRANVSALVEKLGRTGSFQFATA